MFTIEEMVNIVESWFKKHQPKNKDAFLMHPNKNSSCITTRQGEIFATNSNCGIQTGIQKLTNVGVIALHSTQTKFPCVSWKKFGTNYTTDTRSVIDLQDLLEYIQQEGDRHEDLQPRIVGS